MSGSSHELDRILALALNALKGAEGRTQIDDERITYAVRAIVSYQTGSHMPKPIGMSRTGVVTS